MNPIELPFEVTIFTPRVISSIMISSVAISIAGLALAFFSSNSLAVIGFSLLGVCSIIGFCLIEEAEDLNQLAQIQQQEIESIEEIREITSDLKIHTSTISKTDQLFRFFSKQAKKLEKQLHTLNNQVDHTLAKAPSKAQTDRLNASLEKAKAKFKAEHPEFH